jgi:hypothetical protein
MSIVLVPVPDRRGAIPAPREGLDDPRRQLQVAVDCMLMAGRSPSTGSCWTAALDQVEAERGDHEALAGRGAENGQHGIWSSERSDDDSWSLV